MSYQPLLLPGFETGLVTVIDDSLIPEDAFTSLINAYVWRKHLLKKGGYYLFGRLGRRQDDITAAGGTLNYFPIEPGSLSYVEGANTYTDTPINATTGSIAGGTITYATGVYAGLPFPGIMSYNVVVDQYSPVMGLYEREISDINEEELVAFDRLMAYVYDGTSFTHSRYYIGGVNTVEWTGTDVDFFNCSNYKSSLWATNGVSGLHGYAITGITNAVSAVITIGAHGYANGDIAHISGVQGMTEINGLSGTVTATTATTITVNINSAAFGVYIGGGFSQAITHSTAASGDGIRWYAGNGWANFAPPISSTYLTEYLQGCKFILPYKDRLVAFNTWEGTTYAGGRQYPNRIRWCASLSTPYYSNVFPTGESYSSGIWYQEPGAGGYLDAPTNEHITGVEYLKDHLLVLFEQSAYLLVYTGNRNLPFVFQKINTNFGCESPNGLVSFDDNVLSVGDRGIYSISSSGAERIDGNIPNIAFEMQNDMDGTKRVYGVRNFFPEVVFWSYRSIDTFAQGTYPNRILLYNYANQTWAIFKNSFTCFGSHITSNTVIWDAILEIWDDYDVLWDDAKAQSNNPTTIAGNQQGFVFGLNLVGNNTINGNDKSLVVESITTGVLPSVITCINHNLEPGDFIYFKDGFGTSDLFAQLDSRVYRVSPSSYSADTFTLLDDTDSLVNLPGTYYGGTKIIVLDNFEVVTKCFNPYLGSGGKSRFGMIDILATCDDSATIYVESYVDKRPYNSPPAATASDCEITFSYPTQNWYRIYPQVIGQFIQIKL